MRLRQNRFVIDSFERVKCVWKKVWFAQHRRRLKPCSGERMFEVPSFLTVVTGHLHFWGKHCGLAAQRESGALLRPRGWAFLGRMGSFFFLEGGVWGCGGLLFKKHNTKLYFLSFADLLDKMLLILLGVLVLHLIILILLTVATSASVSVSPQFFRLKKMKEKNVH